MFSIFEITIISNKSISKYVKQYEVSHFPDSKNMIPWTDM